jgi:hypothetical protein
VTPWYAEGGALETSFGEGETTTTGVGEPDQWPAISAEPCNPLRLEIARQVLRAGIAAVRVNRPCLLDVAFISFGRLAPWPAAAAGPTGPHPGG